MRQKEAKCASNTSNQPSPAVGDWGNIAFASTAVTTTMDADGTYLHGSVLQHCVVEYAGADVDSAIDARSLLHGSADRPLYRT